jgi:putative ABC transport system permease protein
MASRQGIRLRALAAKLRGFLFGQRRGDEFEFDAEIQDHMRRLADRYVSQGMSRAEATDAARRQFGNITMLREDRRELQTLASVEAWWRDLRYALRVLWKDRGFAVVSIVTLGLGIGAATAIFSVVYNILLAPFPYPAAERVVFPRIHNVQQGEGAGRQGYRPAEVLEFAENNHVFDGIAAAFGEAVRYNRGDGTEVFVGARVTPGSFEFFGMPALHGRVMLPDDYEPASPPVFVMRHRTWMERFNGDLSLLGKTFVLNGTARTLVGIMPPRFGWYNADLYIPQKLTRDANTPPFWFMLGRLKPDVSIEQAQAELTVIANRLAKMFPQDYPRNFTVQVRSQVDSSVSRFRPTLYTVLAAVGLLLLIACSNVANLMLARATMREKEFALRVVLGAGRARLVRLVMIESLVLAAGGAMLGILLAWGGLRSLVAAMPPGVIPAWSVIELNAPVLAFTLCVGVLTALFFGLVPAFQSSRRDLNSPLRDSGKGVSGGFRGRRLRDAVVVIEVALSLTLLIGAGLLMRSFAALRDADVGLRAEQVFNAGISLPANQINPAAKTERVPRFFEPLLTRVKALPGVIDASMSSANPPFSGGMSKIEIAGTSHGEEWLTLFQHVSEGYFRVLRVDFTKGRPFSTAEVDNARQVAVVNETFVRKYLSDGDPIGRRVRLAGFEAPARPGQSDWFEVIGVVADVVNSRGMRVPIEPEVWMPYTIAGSAPQVLMVRTSQDPGTIANAVRRAVWATDAGAALMGQGGRLEGLLDEQLYSGPRFSFLLMTLFGFIGLLLVAVGVYGVLAYSTTQKTHEIGVRMALGAKSSDALGLVVRAGLRLVLAGIALGIPVSLALGRVIGTQLVGVTVYDPLTLAATTVLLTLTAAIACWIPARRAARVDPMIALRYE